jgi:hypothetical protein
MNTTGCLDLYATDGVFQIPSKEGSCDSSLLVFYGIGVFLTATRFMIAVKVLENWRESERKKKSSSNPILPLMSFACASVYLIGTFLYGTNVANMKNGTSFVIYQFGFLIVACLTTASLIRMVRVGNSLITINSLRQRQMLMLSRLDGVGKILFVIQIVSLSLNSLFLLILSPANPIHSVLFSRIGFGFKSLYLFSSLVGILYQYERCIRSIRALVASMITQQGELGGRTQRVLKRMRWEQFLFFCLTSIPSLIDLFLAIDILPWTIWVFYVTMIPEVVLNFFLEFFLKGRNGKRSPPPSPMKRDHIGIVGFGFGSKVDKEPPNARRSQDSIDMIL